MKERGILFSAPMVRALLAGTKTQTRRVVKLDDGEVVGSRDRYRIATTGSRSRTIDCPYGQPGDRLWVREAWSANFPMVGYRADGADRYFGDSEHRDALRSLYDRQRGDWRPGIHMPRWACRLVLEVTEVRVERLQAISHADAIAEGIEHDAEGGWKDYLAPALGGFAPEHAVSSYATLWRSINGEGSWDANPWVWAVSFRRVTP